MWLAKDHMINNEKWIFDVFFKYHVGGDDKMQIILAWPY